MEDMTEPIEVSKLRPFSLEDWRKDEKQEVWYVDGRQVTELAYFSTGQFAGVLSGIHLCFFSGSELRLGPKPSRWVNLNDNLTWQPFTSKEDADKNARPGRIACVELPEP